jgi:hypothetical protein
VLTGFLGAINTSVLSLTDVWPVAGEAAATFVGAFEATAGKSTRLTRRRSTLLCCAAGHYWTSGIPFASSYLMAARILFSIW